MQNWYTWNFGENETEIMQHVLIKQYISFLPEHKNKSLGVFSNVRLQWAMQVFKWLQGIQINWSVSICI
jgi:hypothetical protein